MIPAAPRLDRLTTLAAHLDLLPDELFYLGAWFASRKPTDRELDDEMFVLDAEDFESNDCGTIACAVGHACRIPEFQTAGLKVLNNRPVYVPEKFKYGDSGWSAVMGFFGLTESEALHLFLESEYPDGGRTTPAQVVERIRAFVRAYTPTGGPTGNPA